MQNYLIGFIFSIILIICSLSIILFKKTLNINNKNIITSLLLIIAILQIIVHMIYFLHMNIKSEKGWIILSLIFTSIVIFIIILGSIWVMYHLQKNMSI